MLVFLSVIISPVVFASISRETKKNYNADLWKRLHLPREFMTDVVKRSVRKTFIVAVRARDHTWSRGSRDVPGVPDLAAGGRRDDLIRCS